MQFVFSEELTYLECPLELQHLVLLFRALLLKNHSSSGSTNDLFATHPLQCLVTSEKVLDLEPVVCGLILRESLRFDRTGQIFRWLSEVYQSPKLNSTIAALEWYSQEHRHNARDYSQADLTLYSQSLDFMQPFLRLSPRDLQALALICDVHTLELSLEFVDYTYAVIKSMAVCGYNLHTARVLDPGRLYIASALLKIKEKLWIEARQFAESSILIEYLRSEPDCEIKLSRPEKANPLLSRVKHNNREQLAVSLAYEFLDADLKLSCSDEVHRWGLFQVSCLRGHVFPRALILEQMAKCKYDIKEDAQLLLKSYWDSGCQYFSSTTALPPDIDTLGCTLILAYYSSGGSVQIPHNIAELLSNNVKEDGSVPIYLQNCTDRVLMGDWCNSGRIRLCTSLVLNPNLDNKILTKMCNKVLQQATTQGSASNYHYIPLYWAFLLLEFLQVANLKPAERTPILDIITHQMNRHRESKQALEQALLIICDRLIDRPVSAGTYLRLMDLQNSDGSFPECPLYLVPFTSHSLRWYQSRAITTAFCLRALRYRE